jgi:hypothetical protein
MYLRTAQIRMRLRTGFARRAIQVGPKKYSKRPLSIVTQYTDGTSAQHNPSSHKLGIAHQKVFR